MSSPTPLLDLIENDEETPDDGISLRGLLNALPFAALAIVLFAGIAVLLFKAPEWLSSLNQVVNHFGFILTPLQSVLDAGPFWFGGVVAFNLVIGVAIHEAGHSVTAILVGLPLRSITIFGIAYDFKRKKFWRDKLPNEMWGRVHADGTAGSVNRKFRWFYAAGSTANVVVGIICILGLPFITGPLADVGVVAIGVNLFLGLGNLLSPKSIDRKLIRATSNPDSLKRMLAELKLHRDLSIGKNVKTWNRRWVELCEPSADAPAQFPAIWLAYVYWNSKKDDSRASACLEAALMLRKRHPEWRDLVTLEAAVFQAWFRCDAEKSSVWRNRVRNFGSLPPITRHRFDSVTAWIQGDIPRCLKEWSEARSAIDALPASEYRTKTLAIWDEYRLELEGRPRIPLRDLAVRGTSA